MQQYRQAVSLSTDTPNLGNRSALLVPGEAWKENKRRNREERRKMKDGTARKKREEEERRKKK